MRTFTLYFMVVLFGCTQTPKKLSIEKEKLIDILIDMHYVEAATEVYDAEQRDSITTVFENQVFEIHNIKKSDYSDAIDILENDLDLYYDIQKEVHKIIKQRRDDKE